MKSNDYLSSGVSLDAARQVVEQIKPFSSMTRRPEVVNNFGGFAAMFDLGLSSYKDPLLVSATDGVGTKSEIAKMTGNYETIGIDLVAMCVDDLVCVGAEPLFFLDYIAIGHLNPELVESLIKGIAEGCVEAGCSLIGGETAEHPGVMGDDSFDLAGFSVGAVERNKVIEVSNISDPTEGILITGLPNDTDYSDTAMKNMINNFQSWRKVRMIGSAAMASAYIASGKADAYSETKTYLWDVAAGAALVNAAGGKAVIKNQNDKFQVDVLFTNSSLRT